MVGRELTYWGCLNSLQEMLFLMYRRILAWSVDPQVSGSRMSYPGIDRACFRPNSDRGFLLKTLD